MEALGGVLEGLDGVLEAMLDQDSTKMTNKSKQLNKNLKNMENQEFYNVLGALGDVLKVSWGFLRASWRLLEVP